MTWERCIGVDLGGTKIAAVRVGPDGRVEERIRMETRAEEGPDRVIARIETAIGKLLPETGTAGIGVAAPGPLDARTGVLLSPPNLPGWDKVALREKLEQLFGLPVRLENDANAAAWGEYLFGAGRQADPMLFLTISTGIGGGWVMGGNIVRGADTFAGEVGHMIIDPAGPPCTCGRNGCLEAFSAGWAIAGEGRKAHSSSLIHGLSGGAPEQVTAEKVFEACKRGDPEAERIVRRAVKALAVGLANLIHLFNPRRIVLGGGICRAGEWLLDAIRRELSPLLMPAFRDTCRIVRGTLDEDAGVLGAAALWRGNR